MFSILLCFVFFRIISIEQHIPRSPYLAYSTEGLILTTSLSVVAKDVLLEVFKEFGELIFHTFAISLSGLVLS